MHNIVDVFQKQFGFRTQGTLAFDIRAFVSPPDPDSHHNAKNLDTLPSELVHPLAVWMGSSPRIPNGSLAPRTGVIHKAINHLGVSFKPASQSYKDSNIVFSHLKTHTLVAARIHHIFSIQVHQAGGECNWYDLCAIRQFSTLSTEDVVKDVYQRFGAFSGWVCYEEEGDLDVIQLEDIQSHVAITPNVLLLIKASHIHVLPLDRVSNGFLSYFHLI